MTEEASAQPVNLRKLAQEIYAAKGRYAYAYTDKANMDVIESVLLAAQELGHFTGGTSPSDELERVKAERDGAREALEKIARLRTDLGGDFSMGSHQSDIAREALRHLTPMEPR